MLRGVTINKIDLEITMFINENSKPNEKLKAWYLFTEDFIAGTQALTNEEIGIYIRLLCYNWNKRCSGIPCDNMKYTSINDVGKQWVRKYGLALTKELLGMVRSKYGTIPIPGSEVSLDGDTLRAEATAEKEQLVEQLREILDQTSNRALMEADREASDNLQEKLKKVPYPIYIG